MTSKLKLFYVTLPGVALAGAAALSIRNTYFFGSADICMSPQTAVAAGLMDKSGAPSSGGLAFKALASGGYEYMQGRDYFGFTRKRTDIDIAAVCEKLGGCECKLRDRETGKKRMPGEQAGHSDHHQPL